MTNRTHFVYKAFDAEGVLLYVGCTGDPHGRYLCHMRGGGDARGWFESFVTRWKVAGPYPKDVALSIEKDAIDAGQPIWNGTSLRNRKGRRELIADYLKRHQVRFLENPERPNRPRLVSTARGAA